MMHVMLADAAGQGAWDSYVDGHPGSSPYHRWAWLSSIQNAYGFAPTALIATRGKSVAGVLPLVCLKSPGSKPWLISLPYCDFSGPLADDEAIGQKLLKHALGIAKSRGAAGVEIRRESPVSSGTGKVLMRLALPRGSKRLMDSFSSKLRSQVKKPIRDGLRAEIGDGALMGVFYKILSTNMRDLGSPTHSRAWFGEVVRGFGSKAKLTVVFTPEGYPAACGLMLVEGRRAFVPWASSLREYNSQNANMLLYWAMLSWAADQGLEEFDFGRSSPGQGTFRFKRQWGAKEYGLDWSRMSTAGENVLPAAAGGSKYRRLAEACWRRLPLGVANWAGPVLRRYISL
jgi:FemAB-related protein (PEP-CTERM system-associated)